MKAILIGVNYDYMSYDLEISMQELIELAKACHIEVKEVIIQNLKQISSQYYIGKGKVDEIFKRLDDVDMVIFNEELTPLQVKNLTDALKVEVSDRSDLILRIFESRAKTKEAKLQVDIAKAKYLLPRLAGMNEKLYSQQGGSGFRGRGEKQIELDRRIIHRQLVQSNRELAMIVKQRQTQRRKRQRNQEKVICLVGYTNSGKSSLLNYFTNKKVLEKDMLFASLQTASRQVKIKNYLVVMSDTVGFINQLPHHLVQAFRSTLEEVKEADLLLHVIDSSSPYIDTQIQTTLEVLKSLQAQDIPMIFVYNKIDKGKYQWLQPHHPYVYISVKNEINLDELEDMIIKTLFKDYELTEMIIPYEDGEVFQKLSKSHQIIKEDYLSTGIYMSLYLSKQEQIKYQKYVLKA